MFANLNSIHLLQILYFLRAKVYTQADGKVCIHPKSVNAEETQFNYTWLIYHLKMRTSSVSRRVEVLWMLSSECMLLYLFDFVYEWKEGPVVKGWQWCHADWIFD